MVPNGWTIQKLEQIATVERGKFSARPRNDPKYFGGNIPFVQTGDIAAAKTYLQNYTQTLNEDGLKVSRLFPKDTILITIAANIGDTAITSFDVACPDSLVAIRTNKDTDCFWLKLYLETCKDELDGKATQNAQKNINLQVLKPLEVLTPPYPEQRKIAQILSTWDRGIATTEKLIDASKQQKKALMQQLLTGKKRLVDPETGKAFEGDWEEVKLGDLSSKITKGTTPSTNGFQFQESGINFVKVESILKTGKFEKSKFAYIDEDCHSAFKRSQLEEGDILFSIAGALGRTAIVTIDILPANTNQALSIVRLKKNCVCSAFVTQYLNCSAISATVKGLTAQAAQPNLSLKDVGNLPINLPSYSEQQKIASVLTTADKDIELLEAKLAHLKQEKKALMQQLLTGKRRVKVAETEAA
ncbi:restriction endonuclease subunit S [Vibrio campbellii]|uniref:restriction endonuclease subunit S n=1 Tax=Vibrio campbellii TaxID=680 RepID=UPI004057ADDD